MPGTKLTYRAKPNRLHRVKKKGTARLNIGEDRHTCDFDNKKPADLSVSGPFCNPAASYFPTASQQQYHRPWRA